ncbi:MAG: T9SS type A sorting domain-containing protein [Bacteroidetes bacterium]|nr:T9SS type A sorting domain-containing protein [Bacteroidota bacterium]
MNTHYVGLYLNTGSPTNPTYMGTQPHNGNKWNLPTVSGFGGINLSPSFYVSFSLFTVNSNLGSVYNPVVTPSSWFQPDTTGNTYHCYSSTICSSPPPAMADTTIHNLIEQGIFDSEEVSDESKAIAREYIYAELANDSALWVSDSTYIQFMLENQGEPVAYLYNADEYLKAAYMYDSTLMALIDSCNLQIRLFTDSVTMYSSGTGVGTIEADSLKTAWLYKIGFLNQTINNLNITRGAIIKDDLDNAKLENDYVINGEQPETNSKLMNEIEINYIERGNDIHYLIDNFSGIFAIANQCPYVGGAAVERARTFIALINDSIFYDDANICLQSGIYRFAKDSIKNVEQNKIIIQPNPANDKVEIFLSGNLEGVCYIELKNVMGEIVLMDEMNCKDKHKIIDLGKFSQGVYSVKVHTNNFETIKKLVIVK